MPVKVYTRTSCAPCKALKMYLTRRGISFEEINIDSDPALMDTVIQKSGFAQVPMTQIGENFVSGLNLAKINSLLTI